VHFLYLVYEGWKRRLGDHIFGINDAYCRWNGVLFVESLIQYLRILRHVVEVSTTSHVLKVRLL
jgi:hypothetical protein